MPLCKGILYYSFPVRLRLSEDYPLINSQGSIPIPTKFDQWILSKDSAIITFTPYKNGPLAAQSLEEPDPYSFPAIIIVGIFESMYFFAESKTDIS